MLLVISPAKSLDFETRSRINKYTQPALLAESEIIIKKLKTLTPSGISKLMGVSIKLGQLNYERNQAWQLPFTKENAKQAVLAFNGDVYQSLVANTFSDKQFEFAQKHLRILSGLYGVLRPLDLIQPYRLEMGAKLTVKRKKDLYLFWKKIIAENISGAMHESGTNYLINLASVEYFKSIDIKKIGGEVITPQFKDFKNGSYKMISIFAKKARGLMARFIIENEITNPDDLKAFQSEGYYFNPTLTIGGKLVFTREQ